MPGALTQSALRYPDSGKFALSQTNWEASCQVRSTGPRQTMATNLFPVADADLVVNPEVDRLDHAEAEVGESLGECSLFKGLSCGPCLSSPFLRPICSVAPLPQLLPQHGALIPPDQLSPSKFLFSRSVAMNSTAWIYKTGARRLTGPVLTARQTTLRFGSRTCKVEPWLASKQRCRPKASGDAEISHQIRLVPCHDLTCFPENRAFVWLRVLNLSRGLAEPIEREEEESPPTLGPSTPLFVSSTPLFRVSTLTYPSSQASCFAANTALLHLRIEKHISRTYRS